MRKIPYVIEGDHNSEKIYDLYSRLLKDRVIFLTENIDMSLADDVVAQLLLLEASSSSEAIKLYINSPGGDIDAMYAIYDTMEYVSCPIHTIGYGRVMSAASFLVAAGTPGYRFALPNTNFMIHELSSGNSGKYKEMKNYQKVLDSTYKKMISYYQEFTGQSIKKLEQDMAYDLYLSAEEALSYGTKGLIDSIQSKSFRK